jgi:hypothetical protein
LRHGSAYFNGEMGGADAGQAILLDTLLAGVSSAATTAVTAVGQDVLFRMGAAVLAQGAAPVAIGITTMEIAKDVFNFAAGEMDSEDFLLNTGKNVVKGGMTWGGMEAGAALGTAICPGIGTIIGGIVGGIGAGLLGTLLE